MYWSLRLGQGLGGGVYRDMGTAPFRFKGLLLQPTVSVQCGDTLGDLFSIESRSGVGIFEDAPSPKLNFNAFEITNLLRIKKMWRSERRSPTVYYGVAVSNFADVTVNMNYENAAVGVSEFIGVEGVVRLVERETKKVRLHQEIALMPLAVDFRPGYSYIDNYTSTQPVLKALFDDFEWYLKPFAAVSTDVGIDVALSGNNRMAVNYRWFFISTGHQGTWRFDHASHTLNIEFTMMLKERRKK